MVRNFNLLQELFSLRVSSKIDVRTTACHVRAEQTRNGVRIVGFSVYRQTDAFIRTTAQEVFGSVTLEFELEVLTRDYPLSFHEVLVPSAGLYKAPLIKKEDLLTEALYGCILRTYFEQDGFIFAQHPDGYVGYVRRELLTRTTARRYLRWKNGPCGIFRAAVALDGVVVPPSSKLIMESGKVQLADQKWYRVPSREIIRSAPATSDFADAVQRNAQVFRNTPYLWGGKTQNGIDCSGFVQTLALHEGIKLPRDASMQAYVGEIVGYLPRYADLLPGDLLFFMNDSAYVFHVGIYMGNYNYLHSSGSMNIVRSSLLPRGENYLARYGRTFAFARRVHA